MSNSTTAILGFFLMLVLVLAPALTATVPELVPVLDLRETQAQSGPDAIAPGSFGKNACVDLNPAPPNVASTVERRSFGKKRVARADAGPALLPLRDTS